MDPFSKNHKIRFKTCARDLTKSGCRIISLMNIEIIEVDLSINIKFVQRNFESEDRVGELTMLAMAYMVISPFIQGDNGQEKELLNRYFVFFHSIAERIKREI